MSGEIEQGDSDDPGAMHTHLAMHGLEWGDDGSWTVFDAVITEGGLGSDDETFLHEREYECLTCGRRVRWTTGKDLGADVDRWEVTVP